MKNIKYKIIGYGLEHNHTEWQEFNDSAIVECPEGINPYIYIPASWSNFLDYWIVRFEEIKE